MTTGIHIPTNFDGDRTRTKSFLNACKIYLHLNEKIYPNDFAKITFVLALMEGGTAGPIRASWEDEVLEVDANGSKFGLGT